METIALSYYPGAAERKYHICRITSSALDGRLHSHDYFSFCYVAKGTLLHRLSTQTVRLSHGDAFLIAPGVAHCLEFSDKQSEIYALSVELSLFHQGFSCSHLYRFLTALQMTPREQMPRCRLTLDAEQRLSMQALLESLLRETAADYPPQTSAASSMICAALYLLAQSYAADPVRQAHLQTVSEYADSIEDCIGYVDAHFMEPLSAEALCRRFAVSRTTFSALFPQLAGAPLKRYVTAKRMEAAAERIVRAQQPLTQIAQEVGYGDFSSFYRNFVNYFGCPPSRYRQSSPIRSDERPGELPQTIWEEKRKEK